MTKIGIVCGKDTTPSIRVSLLRWPNLQLPLDIEPVFLQCSRARTAAYRPRGHRLARSGAERF
jgi:hypothetical protein